MTWILLATLAASAVAVEANTLDGVAHRGELVELSPLRALLEVDGEQVELPLAQLRDLQSAAEPAEPRAAGAWVELTDGSALSVVAWTVQDGKARLEIVDGSVCEVASEMVRSVRFSPPGGPLDKAWAELQEVEAAADLLVIRAADNSLDYLEGLVGDIQGEEVEFDLDDEQLQVRREKVAGVIYYHPAAAHAGEPLCTVTTAGGTLWRVRQLTLENDRLRLTSSGGLQVELPLMVMQRIDFASRAVVLLSELEPVSVRWTPYWPTKVPELSAALERVYQPRRLGAAGGEQPLLATGPEGKGVRPYDQALRIRSRTEIVYRLAGAYRRFTAVAGIDARARDAGDAQLRVLVDDQPRVELRAAGEDPPHQLDIDVTGAMRLTIVVDYGDELDIGDHLNLCDARLIK